MIDVSPLVEVEGWRWCAVNENGEVWLHMEKPVIDEDSGEWVGAATECSSLAIYIGKLFYDLDWRESLQPIATPTPAAVEGTSNGD
jgi:hypothetical protein